MHYPILLQKCKVLWQSAIYELQIFCNSLRMLRRSNIRLGFGWLQAHKLLLAIAVSSQLTTCISSALSADCSAASTYTSSAAYSTVNNNKNCADNKLSTKMSDVNAAEEYAAGSSSVAFVTTPDENSAKKLARSLIEHKLAACVNIIPQIQSIYMWEGKINEDNEYLMMIKTRTSRVAEVSKWVRENHPYSVAEVIALPIENGNLPYLKWIEQTVPEKL